MVMWIASLSPTLPLQSVVDFGVPGFGKSIEQAARQRPWVVGHVQGTAMSSTVDDGDEVELISKSRNRKSSRAAQRDGASSVPHNRSPSEGCRADGLQGMQRLMMILYYH